MKQTEPRIHWNEYEPYYLVAKEKSADKLADYFGVKNISGKFCSRTISQTDFSKLKEFAELETHESFSFVSDNPGVFCIEQAQKTLKGYNTLIGTIEYQMLSQNQKNRIIDQQIITADYLSYIANSKKSI